MQGTRLHASPQDQHPTGSKEGSATTQAAAQANPHRIARNPQAGTTASSKLENSGNASRVSGQNSSGDTLPETDKAPAATATTAFISAKPSCHTPDPHRA